MSLASRVARLEKVVDTFGPSICQCKPPYTYVVHDGVAPGYEVHDESPTCPRCGLEPELVLKIEYKPLGLIEDERDDIEDHTQ